MPNDLFVSYSRRDNEDGRVERLIHGIKTEFQALAGRPLEVFIDHRIRPMEDWERRIRKELCQSRLLLTVMTPAFLKSDYCKWECCEYLSREIESSYSGEGIVPVYLEQIPGWDNRDFEVDCPDWVLDLRRRQRFDLTGWNGAAPNAPDDGKAQAWTGRIAGEIHERIRRRERAERSPGNVEARNPHFRGRKNVIDRIHQCLLAPAAYPSLTVLHGLGGMGKSSLARAFAHWYADEYGGGRWVIACDGHTDLRLAFASLRGRRELGFEFTAGEDACPDLRFERVLRELKLLVEAHEPHRCLVILDNVEHRELLRLEHVRRLPSPHWLHVLVTTRLGPLQLPSLEPESFIHVDRLSEEEGLHLFESFRPQGRFGSPAERKAAREIVEALEGFPLALEIAAVRLSQADSPNWETYVTRLKSETIESLEDSARLGERELDHGEKSVMATLGPILDLLKSEDRLALDYASLLPPECIAWEWLEVLVGDVFPEVELAESKGELHPWKAIRSRLQSLSLMKPSVPSGLCQMHRIVQKVVRNQPGFKRKRLRADLIGYVLHRCEKATDMGICDDLRDDIEPLTAWARQLMSEDPDNGGLLQSALGNLHYNMGRYRVAWEFLNDALRVTEDLYGPVDPRVATCLYHLGRVALKLGDYADAKLLANRALSIDDQPENRDESAISMDSSLMGWVEKDLGHSHKAKRWFQKALAIDRRVCDPTHPALANDYSYLGQVERDLGNYAQAKGWFEKSLAIAARIYKSDHPNLATCYTDLGRVEQNLGNYAQAKGWFEKSLAIAERIYESGHPSRASNYTELGRVEQNLGNYAQAKGWFEKSLAIAARIYESDHPALGVCYADLGQVEQYLGNYAASKGWFEKALAIAREAYDPDHPELAILYSILGRFEKDMGNYAAAKGWFEKSVAIAERIYESDHPTLAICYTNLGRVEQDLGNYAASKGWFEKSLSIDERVYDADHPSLASDYTDLGCVERNLGNLPQAGRLLDLALSIYGRALPENHPYLAYSYFESGLVERELGNLEEARDLMQRALSIREKVLPSTHPDLAEGYFSLAGVLLSLGRVRDAEPLAFRALGICRHFGEMAGHAHPKKSDALDTCVRVLKAAGLDETEIDARLREFDGP